VRQIERPDDPHVYYRGDLPIVGTSDSYEVVVTALLEPGNVTAGVETTELLKRWQPRYVLVVGIAGGFPEKQVQKGDVLIANYVYYYEPGKSRPLGEERRARQYRCDRILWAKAKNYEAAEWKGEVGVALPGGFETYVPRALFGTIGCGELVVADEKKRTELLAECSQMLGVAMEAAGVAMAVENADVGFLEIRGVSDTADLTKDDAWHEYAANSAAAFTAGFLRSKPVSTLAERARMETSVEASKPPLTVIRAQSLRAIGSDEIFEAFSADMKLRDCETVTLDFTDLMTADRNLDDPDTGVDRVVDPNGPLLAALGRRDETDFIFHGLVHIPLAMLAGFIVSDRQAVQLFDFHPNVQSGTWRWPGTKSCPKVQVRGVPDTPLRRKGEVIMRVSISYPSGVAESRAVVHRAALEIDLGLEQPERGIVRSEEQVREYTAVFRQTLDTVAARMSGCRCIHLFYAGPVSLASISASRFRRTSIRR
jgi:nucleoside phosphorylase